MTPTPTPTSELHDLIERKRVLLGCSLDIGSPAAAEMAGLAGFDFVWLDLEHGQASWSEAVRVAQAIRAGGAIPAVRVPGPGRHDVLHALDCGFQIVVVPMVQDVQTAQRIVEQGKFIPLGIRGYAGSTRGGNFGLGDPLANIAAANARTHLFVQIETVEGVKHCEGIVGVEGVSGGVVGPADLSFSLGKPLDFTDPYFVDMFSDTIRQVRAAGKLAMTVTANPALLDAAMKAGVQMLVTTTEGLALRTTWERAVKEHRARMDSHV